MVLTEGQTNGSMDIECLEINPQLVLYKGVKTIQWEKNGLQQMVL